MNTKALVSLIAVAALLVQTCSAQGTDAEKVSVTRSSPDGNQTGTVTLEGSSGQVSAQAKGSETASASSTLVIGPGMAQGSFSAEGDGTRVADSLSVEPAQTDEADKPAETEAAVTADEPKETTQEVAVEQQDVEVVQEAQQEPEEQVETVEPQEVKEEEAEEKEEAEDKPAKTTITVGDVKIISSGGDGKVPEKVCLVADNSEFKQFLNDGFEVTLVEATEGGQVKITIALELASVSSKNIITSDFIPEEIRTRCGVSYEDLGLEERTGGESSLSSSAHSFHYTSNSGSAGSETAASIRRRVYARLCSESFFRHFVLYNECHKFDEDPDYESADNYGQP